MKREKEGILELCVWTKLKKILLEQDVKNRDKTNYKEKVGRKLIKDNKLLSKEFFFWCDIFNEYKQKLPLFYEYAKSYKIVFTEIKINLEEIKNKIQMDEQVFSQKICNVVFKYTSKSEYKEIYMFNTEYLFEERRFSSNMEKMELNDRNFNNSDYVINLLTSENIFFEREIENIKIILDSMTDLCESNAILDMNILTSLIDYLKNHQSFLAKNIHDV